MAQKITPNRGYTKALDQEGNAPEKRKYTNEEAMKKYFNDFNKSHYRTVGIKFNVDKEKDILAWLDYQLTLKPYLKKLIVEDMNKPENAEKLEEAKDYYDACLEGKITTKNIPNYPKKKLSDVLMKCESCGADTTITPQTYIKLIRNKTDFICQKCGSIMRPVNQSELTEEELAQAEKELNVK